MTTKLVLVVLTTVCLLLNWKVGLLSAFLVVWHWEDVR